MRFLVTGSRGQVGWELTRSLAILGEVLACDRCVADLSQPESLRSIIRKFKPDVIVNAAAYTAVDKAEAEEPLATVVNCDAVRVLAEESRTLGALLVHYSTEYVFDGTKDAPYVESDIPNPLNAYGRSKLAGERAIQEAGGDWLILRTSWVFGPRGANFLLKMLQLAAERETLRVVCDQFGAPTTARMIADATAHIIRRAVDERRMGGFANGVYHLSAAGRTDWHAFATAIIDAARTRLPQGSLIVRDVASISAADYPVAARRPTNSLLDNTSLEVRFGISRPAWEVGMLGAVDDLAEQAYRWSTVNKGLRA
jgi:dTDP-4-dehydrorhamnose reductase